MELKDNPIANLLAGAETQSVEQPAEVTATPQETEQEPIVDPVESQQTETTVEQPENQEVLESETIEDSDSGNVDDPRNEEDGTEEDTQETKPWWDDDSEATSEVEDQIDYSALSNALGVDASNRDGIVEAFQNLKQENDQYKETVSKIDEKKPYANDRIEKANEIAQNGGNWEEYLSISQADWDLVSDQDIFVETQLRPVFGEDVDGMREYLEKMNPADLKMKSSQIRDQFKAEQRANMDKIAQDAAAKRAKTDENIRRSLDAKKEMFGMKLTPSMRKEVYEDITGNNFLNSIFYDKNGQVNHDGMVEAAFLLKNIKGIMKANMTKYVNKGREEIIESVTNPQVRRREELPTPTKKETSPIGDLMADLMKRGPQ